MEGPRGRQPGKGREGGGTGEGRENSAFVVVG